MASAAASMALQVVVSPFLGVLFDNLTSPISKEVELLWGVDKELKKLISTVSSIQAVLEDAENKQVSSKAITDWLLKLKDAAYDADDILDEWTTEASRIQQVNGSDLLSCFSFDQIKIRHKIGKRMRELNQRFDDIASQSCKFSLREGVVERRAEIYPNRITSSILTESEIYGREGDTSYIVEWLLSNTDSEEDLCVFTILGMGGIGKTTVAQSVYNDKNVKEHFDLKIWVCVSNDFDLRKLTRAVLDSVEGGSCNSEQLDPLQRRLQEKLSGKRFLIVLDDVWNENQQEWDQFKFSLQCGAKGSSVIVTTRLETVASITSTCPPYFLKYLSKEDCWALFKRYAFGMGNEERQALVKIGKEIVKKGRGVPLAAKVLGSLMRFKSEESEWVYVRDSKIWDLPQSNENTIMPALRLSYTHLPPHLRQCFAYCSLFPQDFKMRKEEVIKLWMANGLTQPREGTKMEDIGNGILNSLVWRSFFQVEEKDSEGNLMTFVMHDLVHDLSCFVAKNECCNIDWNHRVENIPNGTRHLLVKFEMPPSSSIYQSIHQSATKLRTLIFNSQFEGVDLSTFKCLRALSTAHFGNGRIRVAIPESIGNLKHLRYLDLSGNNFKYLPKAICGLRNLQTLKLEGCNHLLELPKCLSNLSSLRHLNIKECYRLSKMPKDMRKMTCLQTLSMFIVGANKGRDIKELERMDSLTGEFEILCLENVRSRKDAECANLMRKKWIETLVLTWYNHIEEENELDVIEGLQPDSNLRNIVISGYQGICFPRWLECSTLPNLVAICLKGCTRCELPPSLSRLPFLRTLSMVGMPCVKFLFHIEVDNCNADMVNRFSSLEDLDINDMPELEDWCLFIGEGCGEGQMFLPPRLKTLRISKCPKLRMVPWSPSLETLRVAECSEMVLGSLKNLPCLSSLDISYFDEVTFFPEGSLQYLNALESFIIDGFKQLKILPRELGDLSKLTSLKVRHCDELVSLPEEMINLSSLRSLVIERCKNLESLPEMGMNSLIRVCTSHCQGMTNLSGVINGCDTVLQSLLTYDCAKLDWNSIKFVHLLALRSLSLSFSLDMTSLPDRIQDLSSTLQNLSLNGDSLVSLPEWIGNLTELQSLHISQCRKFTKLPEGLRHLTNLKQLVILDCHPDLQRRCQSSKGEDWHKISHIPRILVEAMSR